MAMASSQDLTYGKNLIQNFNFEDDLTGWAPFGSCNISLHTESPEKLTSISASNGNTCNGRCIIAKDRTEAWMGPSQVITNKVIPETNYQVSCLVSLGGEASRSCNVCLTVKLADHLYVNVGQAVAGVDRWSEIKGSFQVSEQPSMAVIYVEGPPAGVELKVMRLHVSAVDNKTRFQYLKEKTEKVRKRDVILKFHGPNAENLAGASVCINQTHNSFPFGTCINTTTISHPVFADFFIENFDWAVFENELKWYSTEVNRGEMSYADVDTLLEFCNRHGKEVRGHCIFWAVDKFVQPWIQSLSRDELMSAVDNRLQELLSRYIGRFRHHDVNNETLHGFFFQDRLGEDINAYMFREAHRIDPSAVLFVNDYNVEEGNDPNATPEKYVEHIISLQQRGAPVGGIGLQGHVSNPVGEVLCHALDKLAVLGLPIWITELDVCEPDIRVRADKLEVVLREAYAHPAVEGVLFWGFLQGHMWMKDAYLVDADGTVNVAGRRYLDLKNEWLSHAEGHVDGCAEFKFRGYHGKYDVEVVTQWGRMHRSFVVDKGEYPMVLDIKV